MHKRGQAISGFFVYALLGVFACMSLLLVVLGARVYRNVTAQTTAHAEERVLTGYIRTRLTHAADAAIGVEKRAEGDVLYIRETYGGDEYVTRIYCLDGSLCELLTAADEEFEPSYGETLCALERFTVTPGNGYLLITAVADGAEQRLTVAVPGMKEAEDA